MRVQAQRAIGEVAGSVLCFVAVLTALVAVDQRVRERVMLLFSGSGSDSVRAWGHHIDALFDAVLQAVRDQSLDNAPLLIFTIVSAVLVVFMLRS